MPSAAPGPAGPINPIEQAPTAQLQPEVAPVTATAESFADDALERADQLADQATDTDQFDPTEHEALQRAGLYLHDQKDNSAISIVGHMDRAQVLLEAGQQNGMGESARELSIRLNQRSRLEQGLPPVDFNAAMRGLVEIARSDIASDDAVISQEGVGLANVIRSINRAPTVTNTTAALKALERNLAIFAQQPEFNKTPLHQEQVAEWRSQRDAIWQRRAELQVAETTAQRARAAEPAKQAAIEQAHQNVAAALGEAPAEAPKDPMQQAMEQIGKGLLQVSGVLRDGTVMQRFKGLYDLNLQERTVMAAAVRDVYQQHRDDRPYGGLANRNKSLNQAMSDLAARMQSRDLFK